MILDRYINKQRKIFLLYTWKTDIITSIYNNFDIPKLIFVYSPNFIENVITKSTLHLDSVYGCGFSKTTHRMVKAADDYIVGFCRKLAYCRQKSQAWDTSWILYLVLIQKKKEFLENRTLIPHRITLSKVTAALFKERR